jgi:PIN domain nuclease of toxin-antitoxin system
VRLLLDTHILLWAALSWRRLPSQARVLLEQEDNVLVFSVASLWEVAIKRGLGREDFRVDPRLLRRGLVDNGYEELAILGQHTVAVDGLPPLHKDPFDRLLIAQSLIEGITLLTVDPLVARYPAPVQAL